MRHHIYLLKDLDQDSIGLDFYNAMAHLFLRKLEQDFGCIVLSSHLTLSAK